MRYAWFLLAGSLPLWAANSSSDLLGIWVLSQSADVAGSQLPARIVLRIEPTAPDRLTVWEITTDISGRRLRRREYRIDSRPGAESSQFRLQFGEAIEYWELGPNRQLTIDRGCGPPLVFRPAVDIPITSSKPVN